MLTDPVTVPLSDSGHLTGTYHAATDRPDFAVLWVHGFGSHRGGEKAETVRAECTRRGWAFAAFDFRGHGTSSGTMHDLRASRLLEDLTAASAWLRARGHTRLGLVGSSMGGFASAWFAKRNPECVVGSVFLAPAFGFLERRWNTLTPEEQIAWVRTGRRLVKNEWVSVEIGIGLIEERDRFRPEDLVRGWRTPSLLFHGLADDVVPDSDSLFFARRVEYPHVELRLLKDGDHRLTAYKGAIAGATGAFFANLVGT
ncbi:alpha/beta fold hydrolase [Gemmata sp. G18]|uniref:Alpha/beta fold hydrolase n=1 Tax=Gemmata palustris TaxID=2822762 RepID=A0ABS5BPR5_9BACT|nr:alpha/beta fold hydrolase [Gemmata palustris]MBP3955720.1 alpha/beta fold hydrolase [Gemmata palustris]